MGSITKPKWMFPVGVDPSYVTPISPRVHKLARSSKARLYFLPTQAILHHGAKKRAIHKTWHFSGIIAVAKEGKPMVQQDTEFKEYEESYICKAKELTRDSPDPDAWKKLWLETRKSFTAEELFRDTREVFVQLRQNYYATFAVEQLRDDASFADSDENASRLETAFKNIYGLSYTGLCPEFDTFQDLQEFLMTTILGQRDLVKRLTGALRLLGWPYAAIGELWNEVLKLFPRKRAKGTLTENICELMEEIRDRLCQMQSGLLASDQEWLCKLVKHKYTDKRCQEVAEFETFCTLYKEYIRPPDMRFERRDNPGAKDRYYPRLRDYADMKPVRDRLRERIKNQSLKENGEEEL